MGQRSCQFITQVYKINNGSDHFLQIPLNEDIFTTWITKRDFELALCTISVGQNLMDCFIQNCIVSPRQLVNILKDWFYNTKPRKGFITRKLHPTGWRHNYAHTKEMFHVQTTTATFQKHAQMLLLVVQFPDLFKRYFLRLHFFFHSLKSTEKSDVEKGLFYKQEQ